MTLEKIQAEMIQAMKNKNKVRRTVLSDIVATVKNAAIDQKCRNDIPESLVDSILLKYKKTTQEMIDTCPADRVDTLEAYKKQMEIVNEFAPVLITDADDVKKMINYILSCNGLAPVKQNKGLIMKMVMPVLRGKVDLAVANKVIGNMLT